MLQKKFLSFFLALCIWLSAAGFPVQQAQAAAPLQTSTFSKIAPVQNASIATSLVLLQWEASSIPGVRYEYCYFTKQNCPNGQWRQAGTNTAATVSVKANTTYYWHVRTRAANGSLTYANNNMPWKFTTVPSTPASFTKTSPVNGSVNNALSVKLTWTASSGFNVNYQVCYDTTNNGLCDSNVWLPAGTKTEYTINGLNYGTTYSWQVRAYNAKATTYANGSTSAFNSFTTRAAPPTPFVKLTPANGAGFMPVNIHLVWSPSSGSNLTYQYCLLTAAPTGTCENSGGQWVSVGASTSTAPAGLAYGEVYWWQVRALSGGSLAEAVEANGGTWWSFHTLVTPPTSFEKLLPAMGAVDVSLTPYLYWAPSSGTGIQYAYCLVETGQPCDNWANMGTQTFVKINTALKNNTSYTWQVRATDVDNNLEFANASTAHQFTTLPAAPSWISETFSTPEDPETAYTADLDATNPGGKQLMYIPAGRQPAGTLVLGSDGAFSYTPEPEFNGEITFSFIIWDGVNNPAGPYTATIQVTAVNDPPVILPIADVSVGVGADIFFTIETTDPDLAYGDTLEIKLNGALPNAPGASFTTSYNPVTHAASADFEWLGTVWLPTHPGPYEYTLTVTDSAGATASDPFTVNIEGNTVFIPLLTR